MDKNRLKEILESDEIVEVIYNNNPVWLESIEVPGERKLSDADGKILVRDLKTNKETIVDVRDLKE